MREVLDWVEACALENLRFHIESAEKLAEESRSTLAFLTAGAGGALAFASDDATAPFAALRVGLAVLAVVLFLCCAVLIHKCMRTRPIPAPTNEPRNLLQDDYTLDELRRVELLNIQARIDEVAKRNIGTAQWLDGVRYAAIAAAAVWAVAITCAMAAGCLSGSAVAAG